MDDRTYKQTKKECERYIYVNAEEEKNSKIENKQRINPSVEKKHRRKQTEITNDTMMRRLVILSKAKQNHCAELKRKKQGRIHGQSVVAGGWAGAVMRAGRGSMSHGAVVWLGRSSDAPKSLSHWIPRHPNFALPTDQPTDQGTHPPVELLSQRLKKRGKEMFHSQTRKCHLYLFVCLIHSSFCSLARCTRFSISSAHALIKNLYCTASSLAHLLTCTKIPWPRSLSGCAPLLRPSSCFKTVA